MSKHDLSQVKGELPKVERRYELDADTQIEVREDGTWFYGTKHLKSGKQRTVDRLARSRIVVDSMLVPIDSDEDRGLRVLIDGRAFTVTREGLATGTEAVKWLTSRGALINPSESAGLLRLIHEAEVPNVMAYTVNGWQKNGAFVVGETVLRGEGHVLTTEATRTKYEARGTFEDWQREVLERAKLKPGWLFMLLTGFTSPLLNLLQIDTGTTFNCFAKSSTGKTAGLKAAAGVWGQPSSDGCLKSMRTTVNAIEGIAQGGNGIGLFLDEMSSTSNNVLREFAYMFGNGVGRERMKSNSEMRKVKHWKCNATMSSEMSVEALFAAMDEAQASGMVLRLIDQNLNRFLPSLPLDEVKGFEDAVSRYYGTAGPEFVRRIMGMDDLRARFDAHVSALYDGDDARIERAAGSYAQLMLAGEIMGIDTTVVVEAWGAWLEEVKASNVTDDHVGIARRIVDFVDERLNSSIIRIGSKHEDGYEDDDEDEVSERGYSSRDRDGWYDADNIYLTARCLDKLLGGFDKTTFCEVMVERGAMVKPQKDRWVGYIPRMAQPRRQAFFFVEDALRAMVA